MNTLTEPTVEEGAVAELEGIIKVWQGLTLDEKQSEIAQKIDASKLRAEIKNLVQDFIKYYNPSEPSQYQGPDNLDESWQLLKDLDDQMRLL